MTRNFLNIIFQKPKNNYQQNCLTFQVNIPSVPLVLFLCPYATWVSGNRAHSKGHQCHNMFIFGKGINNTFDHVHQQICTKKGICIHLEGLTSDQNLACYSHKLFSCILIIKDLSKLNIFWLLLPISLRVFRNFSL